MMRAISWWGFLLVVLLFAVLQWVVVGSTESTAIVQGCPCLLPSESTKKALSALHRRVSALEQPLWNHSKGNLRWSECSQGPCKCLPEAFTLNCWRFGLEEIPGSQTVPVDTTFMDLGSNQLFSLHRHTFRTLTRLAQLDLSDNRLDYLPNGIFEDLESLKYLMLQRNQLDSLSATLFRDLKNLETLDLSENNLLSLPPGLWSPLHTLRVLQLSRNQLQSWTDFSSLRSLEELDLMGNNLSTLAEPFSPLVRLTTLRLGENKIGGHLRKGTLQGLRSLVTLDLHQNSIEGVEQGTFRDLGNLTTLHLHHNLIEFIPKGLFEGLGSLKELDLSRNILSRLGEGSFQGLLSLDRLALHGNDLGVLEVGAFGGLANLSWLLLGGNTLSTIEPHIFTPTPRLTTLELESNGLLNIGEGAFRNLQLLESIKLGKNAWSCDCNILYLANWVRDHYPIIIDYQPKCRGPTGLSGRPLHEMDFSEVCSGQWKSMQNIPARV